MKAFRLIAFLAVTGYWLYSDCKDLPSLILMAWLSVEMRIADLREEIRPKP